VLVVVGGHSRNLGKTSLAAALIRRTQDWKWTAIKITQHGNGIWAHGGVGLGPQTSTAPPFAIREEYEPNKTDSGRFLAAGAERAFWLQTSSRELGLAMPTLATLFAQSNNVIVESNSLVEWVQPDIFLMLLDFSCPDFKASSLRVLDRVDAFVVLHGSSNDAPWAAVRTALEKGKPTFFVRPPEYVTEEIIDFVTAHR
jgi:hypothetical protein